MTSLLTPARPRPAELSSSAPLFAPDAIPAGCVSTHDPHGRAPGERNPESEGLRQTGLPAGAESGREGVALDSDSRLCSSEQTGSDPNAVTGGGAPAMDTAAGNAATAGRSFWLVDHAAIERLTARIVAAVEKRDAAVILRELERIHHRIDGLASKMSAINVLESLTMMEAAEQRILAAIKDLRRERENNEPEVAPV